MSGTSNVYYVPFQMVSATSANMAASITGTVDTQESNCWAIQASWIGTPTGTLKIQTSNDNVAVGPDNNPGVNVINWTDISGSSQSLTGSPGTYIWRDGTKCFSGKYWRFMCRKFKDGYITNSCWR